MGSAASRTSGTPGASRPAALDVWCIGAPNQPASHAFCEATRRYPMQLTGLHHVTAVTADARGNHAFYTDVLGMRLVKKTVNQDDVSAYHLFYADALANP